MFHVNRYRMLEVRRAMRRERICRDGTNPLEIYDDLELIERFRFDRRTILHFQQSRIVTIHSNTPDLECLPAQSTTSVHYLSIEKLKRN